MDILHSFNSILLKLFAIFPQLELRSPKLKLILFSVSVLLLKLAAENFRLTVQFKLSKGRH